MSSHGNQSEVHIVARTQAQLTRAAILANSIGALVVFVFLAYLLTLEPAESSALRIPNGVVFLIYVGLSFPIGQRLMRRRFFDPLTSWLLAGRAVHEDDRRRVLRYPLNLALVSGAFWAAAAALFSLLYIQEGATVVMTIAVAILLGGVTACALQYLLGERILLPITARALASGAASETRTPGVATRLLMAWILATGVPLIGLLTIGVAHVSGDAFDDQQVVYASLFLATLAATVGLFALVVAVRSVAAPLAAIRGALEQVEHGRFDSRVAVDDGSEVGLLEAGFNRMAAGLGERELLREAFGAYVDPDLANRVMREGTDLSGDEVEVSILFMDVRGFTTYSEGVAVREVVEKLNQLWDQVVPIILEQNGHANKFIGDGLLAVFGAPDRLEDHAERAVCAAREIVAVVRDGDPDGLRVGVGVNSGKVMAGTIGGGGRLDFTVIGDTVNTAARVESATRETSDDVLITAATLERLGRNGIGWVERTGVTLKGKDEAVRLYAPEPHPRRSNHENEFLFAPDPYRTGRSPGRPRPR